MAKPAIAQNTMPMLRPPPDGSASAKYTMPHANPNENSSVKKPYAMLGFRGSAGNRAGVKFTSTENGGSVKGTKITSHASSSLRDILKLQNDHSVNQIAERLVISPKTVDTHRTHVMDKLNLHSRAELVKYAMRRGLLED